MDSFIDTDSPHSALAGAYLHALLNNDRQGAHRIIDSARSEGLSIRDLYLNVFQPVQYEVGQLWLHNRISVAEEHYCTAATQAIMTELYPEIITSPRIGRSLVAACVGPELHELGVRMVADFFEMEGWDAYYLGASVAADRLIAAIREYHPTLVALSATMSYHIQAMKELIETIRLELAHQTPPIMVGGAVFNDNPDLRQRVGADLFAASAAGAVEEARRYVDSQKERNYHD